MHAQSQVIPAHLGTPTSRYCAREPPPQEMESAHARICSRSQGSTLFQGLTFLQWDCSWHFGPTVVFRCSWLKMPGRPKVYISWLLSYDFQAEFICGRNAVPMTQGNAELKTKSILITCFVPSITRPSILADY